MVCLVMQFIVCSRMFALSKVEQEEDIDDILASAAAVPRPASREAVTPISAGFNPLGIQLKCLNPENEMKKRFGHKIVAKEATR